MHPTMHTRQEKIHKGSTNVQVLELVILIHFLSCKFDCSSTGLRAFCFRELAKNCGQVLINQMHQNQVNKDELM